MTNFSIWFSLSSCEKDISFTHYLLRKTALPNVASRMTLTKALVVKNAAFFTTNAFVSVILLATFGSAVFLNR